MILSDVLSKISVNKEVRNMKKLIIFFVAVFTITAFGQFKDNGFPKAQVKDGIVANSSDPLFGFLNSDKFHMSHSYSLSYSTFAGQGLAMGVYTNTMSFQFNKNLNVQLETSIVNTPYSTLGKEFQNNLNGIYISRAALNYKPWDDVSISVQYRNLPYSYYSPWGYDGFYNNGFNNNFFIGR